MTDQIISQVLDFGALGSFAAFLVWQHVNMQKKFEKLVVSFQTQLKEIDSGYERRIEIMRERYDKVISDIRQECRNKEDVCRARYRRWIQATGIYFIVHGLGSSYL